MKAIFSAVAVWLAFGILASDTSCFSKPTFSPSDGDPADSATACVAVTNFEFLNRNAMSAGDITGDGIDDVTLFGSDKTTMKSSVFLYFGNSKGIDFGCANQRIDTDPAISGLGLVKLTPVLGATDRSGVLSYVAQTATTLRLVQIVFKGQNQLSTKASEGVPVLGVLPNWESGSDLSRIPRAAVISDRRPAVNEILFGGGPSMMQARTSSSTGNIESIGSPLTVDDNAIEPRYHAMLAMTSSRIFVISGTTSYIVRRNETDSIANKKIDLKTATPIMAGDGDPSGAVFAARDIYTRDNQTVIALRFPQWTNDPGKPTFQTFRADATAKTCIFNNPSTGKFLTDGTEVTNFGNLFTTFVGVLTNNPSGTSPTNSLVVAEQWNSNACDRSNVTLDSYLLRPGASASSSPILVTGSFQQPAHPQVLLFYREAPSQGECFEPLANNVNHCLAHCGSSSCAN
jgi:hypothetical protein